MLTLSTNVDQKSLETEFYIAICRPTGDKCQSKTLFLVIFDPRSSIFKSIFDLPPIQCDVNNSKDADQPEHLHSLISSP